jgi:hypothetical protein
MQTNQQPQALTNLSNLISSYVETQTLARIQRNIALSSTQLNRLNQETDEYMREHYILSLENLMKDIFSDIAYSHQKGEINLSQYIEILQTLNE